MKRPAQDLNIDELSEIEEKPEIKKAGSAWPKTNSPRNQNPEKVKAKVLQVNNQQ
jgi:hypothetical protein